jgi:acetyl esterase/lipase
VTTSIIVLPGGGYHRHAPHEGEPVAEWLRGLGFASRVVEYPVLTRHPGPLAAVQAEIARERASGATRVGVLGFSAGGHLAGHAALARGGQHPDFAVLCYPVVSMLLPTHRGSRENLIGLRAGWLKRRSVSLERMVTPQSPPIFLWHTIEDAAVPVEHSYLLAAALAKKGVPHELHAFAEGQHGIGFGEGLPAEAWRALCERWLERFR